MTNVGPELARIDLELPLAYLAMIVAVYQLVIAPTILDGLEFRLIEQDDDLAGRFHGRSALRVGRRRRSGDLEGRGRGGSRSRRRRLFGAGSFGRGGVVVALRRRGRTGRTGRTGRGVVVWHSRSSGLNIFVLSEIQKRSCNATVGNMTMPSETMDDAVWREVTRSSIAILVRTVKMHLQNGWC